MFVGLCLACALLVVSCQTGADGDGSGNAKNVILIIGDGMGVAQRDAVQLATVGLDGRLAMDELSYSGMSDTKPSDPRTIITDSAAGGSGLASGVKTYNGAIGVDEGKNSVPTILEQAKLAGKATGLVTTDSVTGATPASFAAHVEERDEEAEIARQYVQETRPGVILGGGGSYFEQDDETGDLIQQARRQGYAYVTDAEELESAQGDKILGLFAAESMFREGPEGEGRYDPAVPLPTMTEKAISTLSRDRDGFFLLVEEEAIDGMSHSNNSELMIEAGQELDGAVRVARDYAEEEPDTLLIVAADHETGGLSVEDVDRAWDREGSQGGDGPFEIENSERMFKLDWTTNGHTGTDVPITAAGPGAENLSGVYANTHVYDVMAESLAIEEAFPIPRTTLAMVSFLITLVIVMIMLTLLWRGRKIKGHRRRFFLS